MFIRLNFNFHFNLKYKYLKNNLNILPIENKSVNIKNINLILLY